MTTRKMKTKTLRLLSLSIFALFLLSGVVSAETIVEWGLTSDGVPTLVNSNINAGNFSGSTGISSPVNFGADGAYASSWSTGTLDSTDYFQITLSPKTGYNLTVLDINFGERRSFTGIVDYEVRWSKSSDFSSSTTVAIVNVPDNDLERTGDISGLNINVDNGETLYVRWFGYNAEGSTGTWRINDNTLSVGGTVTEIPNPSLSVSSSTIPQGQNSTTITVTNTGNTVLNNIQVTASGDFSVSLSPSSNISSLNPGVSSSPITVTMTTNPNNLKIGTNDVTLTAVSSTGVAGSGIVSTEKAYCSSDNPGNLEVEIKNVDVVEGFGDDDQWFLFDDVEVEVRVKNNGVEDIDDVIVEWGLYNKETGEWIVDDEEKDFNLKEGAKKDITIKLSVDDNLNSVENGDFVFYVKAYGDVDDEANTDTCTSDSENLELMTDEDFVILNDIKVSPEVVQCGEEFRVSGDAWNVGENDQDDVSVRVYNSELKLDKLIKFTTVDAFDSEKLDFVFEVPHNAQEKSYSLEFTVYDEDNDVFKNSDDDESTFVVLFDVKENCKLDQEAPVSISAGLSSDGVVGGKVAVRAVITNLEDELSTYKLTTSGYSDWASSVEVDKETLVLSPGESSEVLFTFNVEEDDVSGENSFIIEVLSGDEIVVKQPVSVFIEGKKPGVLARITGNVISGDNWYLWGIGVLNVFLVLVIIIVAVRIARQ